MGLDKADIGKGFRRDIVYFNELNKGDITHDTYIQIATRCGVTYADYNPDRRFWVHDEVIPDKDTDFLVLTFEDNERLPAKERNEILKYKEKGFHNPNKKKLFADDNIKNMYWANKWRVYGLGVVGFLEGVVFENWKVGDFNPEGLQTWCGMDFGFSVDPDALIEMAIDQAKRKLYLKQLLYRTGLKTHQLSRIVLERAGDMLVIADSASPRTIADLEHEGVNIEGVKKGKIEEGVARMQDYEIIVDPESIELQLEFNNYVYADKGTKLYIDDWNHGIDGVRYGLTYKLENQHAGEYNIW